MGNSRHRINNGRVDSKPTKGREQEVKSAVIEQTPESYQIDESRWHLPFERDKQRDPLWKYMAQFDSWSEFEIKEKIKTDKYFCDVIMNLAKHIGTNIFRRGCKDVFIDAYLNVQHNNVFISKAASLRDIAKATVAKGKIIKEEK